MADMKRYGFLIDLRKCIGCQTCQIVCKSENDVPTGVFRTWVKEVEKGTYPKASRSFIPLLCNNCEHPICVTVCPVRANRKREDGIVTTDPHRCVACRYCMAACPYEVRYVHPFKKIVEKCNWCEHRVDQGLLPSCVLACPTGTRVFGDIEDPESDIAKLIAENPVQVIMPEMGTGPHVYYIGFDEEAFKVKRKPDRRW